jgi:hypothetical protein
MSTRPPTHLSDADLIAAIARLALTERGATIQLIAHLAEFDARDLYLREGFSSLFTYCCDVLHLSEHESYSRIEAARASRRFPAVLEALADGLINLTTIRLLVPRLTEANHRELLAAASHLKKREVEQLIAERFPCQCSLRPSGECPFADGQPQLRHPRRDPQGRLQPLRWSRIQSRRFRRRSLLQSSCPAHPTVSRSASVRVQPRATSSAWRRTCCGTRFRVATRPRSSTGRSISC